MIDYLFRMKPDRNLGGTWELHLYGDAEYAGDNYTWNRVTG